MSEADWERSNQVLTQAEGPPSPLLHGEYEVTRDKQGRIVLPSDCRRPFEDTREAMVGPAPDGASLHIFPVATWREWINRLRQARAENDREAGWLLRLYTSLYHRCRVQGETHRITLSDSLAELAGIGRGEAAYIVGKGDRLQVFSEEGWREYRRKLLDTTGQIPEDSRWQV